MLFVGQTRAHVYMYLGIEYVTRIHVKLIRDSGARNDTAATVAYELYGVVNESQRCRAVNRVCRHTRAPDARAWRCECEETKDTTNKKKNILPEEKVEEK